MIFGENLAELLNRPFYRWVIGHVDVKNPARPDLHGDEDVEYAERRSNRDEKIASDHSLGMILNKCSPTLVSAAVRLLGTQVFRYGPRRDPDSELDEQFISDVFFSPCRIFPFESANNFS